MATKDFHLSDILTITTGHFVSTQGIGGIYEILNFMTGDELFTHQLPRAGRECEPHLLRQHPQLKEVNTDALKAIPEGAEKEECERICAAWLAPLIEQFGERLPVETIPTEDHAKINPIVEAIQMKGGDASRVVVIGEQGD